MSHEHENLIISLMEARKKGKTIQYYDCDDGWLDMKQADYNFPDGVKYRIKPDEPREFLLAKPKHWDDISVNWLTYSGYTRDDSLYDYIRVREIVED
jgi:hypothetical protein